MAVIWKSDAEDATMEWSLCCRCTFDVILECVQRMLVGQEEVKFCPSASVRFWPLRLCLLPLLQRITVRGGQMGVTEAAALRP